MRVVIENYGCTANLGIAKEMESLLKHAGIDVVVCDGEKIRGDIFIINTCVVTQGAEQRVKRRIEELRGNGMKVLVSGCLPMIEEIDGGIKSLEDLCREFGIRAPPEVVPEPSGIVGVVSTSTGCVGRCTYCITKLAKGDLRSREIEKVVRIVRSLVERGVKEIRLTSQDMTAYGLDLGTNLPNLLRELCSIRGDFMIRVGMMNPSTAHPILDELVESFESEKIFKFAHVPVQSGSNDVLRLMNRGYTVEMFLEIVQKFRSAFPDLTLSTDFIVGFPGEGEEDFEQTLSLLRRIRSTKVNIKRFSPRPGTPAHKMRQLPESVKMERSRLLSHESKLISYEELKKWVGRSLDVLVTEVAEGGVVCRDPTYKYLLCRRNLCLGSRANLRVSGCTPTYLVAE